MIARLLEWIKQWWLEMREEDELPQKARFAIDIATLTARYAYTQMILHYCNRSSPIKLDGLERMILIVLANCIEKNANSECIITAPLKLLKERTGLPEGIIKGVFKDLLRKEFIFPSGLEHGFILERKMLIGPDPEHYENNVYSLAAYRDRGDI